jgi:hypothetical protein
MSGEKLYHLVVHPRNHRYNLGHWPQEVPHGVTRSYDD